jgi:hypothetical protein
LLFELWGTPPARWIAVAQARLCVGYLKQQQLLFVLVECKHEMLQGTEPDHDCGLQMGWERAPTAALWSFECST